MRLTPFAILVGCGLHGVVDVFAAPLRLAPSSTLSLTGRASTLTAPASVRESRHNVEHAEAGVAGQGDGVHRRHRRTNYAALVRRGIRRYFPPWAKRIDEGIRKKWSAVEHPLKLRVDRALGYSGLKTPRGDVTFAMPEFPEDKEGLLIDCLGLKYELLPPKQKNEYFFRPIKFSVVWWLQECSDPEVALPFVTKHRDVLLQRALADGDEERRARVLHDYGAGADGTPDRRGTTSYTSGFAAAAGTYGNSFGGGSPSVADKLKQLGVSGVLRSTMEQQLRGATPGSTIGAAQTGALRKGAPVPGAVMKPLH